MKPGGKASQTVKVRTDLDREEVSFAAGAKTPGLRLDSALVARFPGYSRTHFQKLIRSGEIIVNGSPAKPSQKVLPGDRVTIFLTRAGRRPEEIPLDVIYEDEALLAINKPPGIVVHPARGHLSGTVFNGLLRYFAGPLAADADFHFGFAHRLDEDTSGVLLIVKGLDAHKRLTFQFEHRLTAKEYTAVVHGVPDFTERVIDLPLGAHKEIEKKIGVRYDIGKEAVTCVRVEERLREAAVVRARPKTGRSHQIRVHLAEMGHPIVGDTRYGGRTAREDGVPLISRQALHSAALEFEHPATGRKLKITADLPADMRELIEKLRG